MSSGGRASPSAEALLRRRREAVFWRSRGYTMETILFQLNNMAAQEGWGTISEQTLYNDLRLHYDDIIGQWELDPVKRLKNYKTQKNLQLRQIDQNIEELRKIIMEDAALRRNRSNAKPQQNAFLMRPLSPGQLSEYYKVLHMFMDMKNNMEGWGGTHEQRKHVDEMYENKESNTTVYDEFVTAAKNNPDLVESASRIAAAIKEVLPFGADGQGSETSDGVVERPKLMEGAEGIGGDVYQPSGVPGFEGDSVPQSPGTV